MMVQANRMCILNKQVQVLSFILQCCLKGNENILSVFGLNYWTLEKVQKNLKKLLKHLPVAYSFFFPHFHITQWKHRECFGFLKSRTSNSSTYTVVRYLRSAHQLLVWWTTEAETALGFSPLSMAPRLGSWTTKRHRITHTAPMMGVT